MDFVEGLTDLGAQEFNVTGIASIERISDGQVRVTYFIRRKGELNIALHLIWDRKEWLTAWRVWDASRSEITDPEFGIDAGKGLQREMH